MLQKIGWLFQLIGLVLPLVAISGNIAREDLMDLRASLTISGVGIGLFVIGWLLQQGHKRS